MTIDAICNSIKTVFDAYLRPSVKSVNPYLIWCSAFKRPGLSVVRSYSNIVQALAKAGIPTGPCPDGQPNYTLIYALNNLIEVYRAHKEDSVTMVSTMPGITCAVQVGPSGTGTGTIVQSTPAWGVTQ